MYELNNESTTNVHLQAAGLLKRAEGLVTLVVCNPNKKEEKVIEEKKSDKKGVQNGQ